MKTEHERLVESLRIEVAELTYSITLYERWLADARERLKRAEAELERP